MPRTRLTALALMALIAPAAARAAEVPCWFDGGVVVVPASVAGVAGDFILDTGSARTELHDTRAQSEGVAEPQVTGDILLAGMRLRGRTAAVADLDVRTWNLPTPVAGVIGADVLKDFVVDVDFAPCRVRLSRPGRAPPFRGQALALTWDAGRPTAQAAVSDGERILRGPFVIATGANVAVRLADDLAAAPGAEKPEELGAQGVWLARLETLSFAGELAQGPAAGLMTPHGGTAGVIGGPALSRYRLRFDFPRRRLVAAP